MKYAMKASTGNTDMRIAIFGATGRTGKPVVEQALQAGHEVTALVRDPSKMTTQHGRLRIVQGDVLDLEVVEVVVKGQDAVLLVLNHTQTSPKDVLTRGTENVLAAMKKHGVRRIINLTGAGVADPQDRPRLWNKVISFLLKRMAGDLLTDAERQAELIHKSGLDWTIVRGPMLTEGPYTGQIKAGYVGQGTGPRIARADVAGFMLQQLTNMPMYIKHR
jgi:putative NADH-flavin reductase